MDFAAARRNMVDGQLRPNKVSDASILAVMEEQPRELFVPKALRGVAYNDDGIDLGAGRYLMEPVAAARLLQAAKLQRTDTVLVIGCASAYNAALIGQLVASVVAIECDAAAVRRSTEVLNEASIDNVAVVEGRLADGAPNQAPFDAIFFDGAVAEVPAQIVNQLAEGGRLVAVVSGERGVGQATLFERTDGMTSSRVLFDAAVPVLPDLAHRPQFVF